MGNGVHSNSYSKDGLCGICPAGCWVRAHYLNDRLVKVEPHPEHHLGMICRIGHYSPEIIYDPDRLLYPLRRKGPKGTYDFERISWDEAYEIIVSRLESIKREHGPEACAIYTGRGSFDMALCDLFQPDGVAVSSASSVLFPFGSPNTLGVGALCYVSFAMIAPHVTMGEMLISMDTDLEQAELIVIWGANPATDSPPFSHQQIVSAKKRGAEIVSIDPRHNETCKITQGEWIPIRPGTDGALALSMIQVLLEEELYDEDFADNWTVGFSELTQLTQHYRPEIVENITGIPEDTIRSLARRIASARGACPVMYTGLEYSDSGVQAIRAALTLWGLAGQLDVPGGLLIKMKENVFPQNRTGLIPNPDMRKALGRSRFPVYSMYRGESHAIALPDSVLKDEPYRVRSLIIQGASICTSWPNPDLWKQTLAALDFLVTIDRYHTVDSAFADVVLPATTMYEITSYMRYGPLFKIREKMVEPQGEARSDFLIISELANRLGYGHLYPQTEDDIIRWALKDSGSTLEEVRQKGGSVQVPTVMMQYKKWEKGSLRPDKEPGFNTPSGKFEIASTVLAEHGYEPLPVYTEPREGPLNLPEQAEKYPLVFNSGSRTYYDFRSQHHGVKGLSAKQPEPIVTLNSEDAAGRGIGDNDLVWVETPRGSLLFRAHVTDDIVKGAIDANMGGGGPLGPEAWQNCNVNELTDMNHFDPISGFPIYKTLLCQVTRAANQEATLQAEPEHSSNEADVSEISVRSNYEEPHKKVYLDNNATTQLHPEVLEAMMPFLQKECGNPSSIHRIGKHAHVQLEEARRSIAQTLNCTARRIVLTSGGSEANNLAIQGTIQNEDMLNSHIITSAIEHPAVIATCKAIEKRGVALTVLPVSSNGLVDPEILKKALKPNTVLISIMTANNEIGTIEPIKELVCVAKENGILFHTDAVQALGKLPLDIEEMGVDMLSVSAHKVYGPKGIGALYVRKGVSLSPLIYGGGQEHGLRSGTENVAGIIGFGKACEIAQQVLNRNDMKKVIKLRDKLEAGVMNIMPSASLNGDRDHRLPNTLNMHLPGIRGESLVLALDNMGIFFSSGSACKSGNPTPSATLLAIGLTEEEAHCSVRFSLGSSSTDDDINYTLEVLKKIINDTTKAVRFMPCR